MHSEESDSKRIWELREVSGSVTKLGRGMEPGADWWGVLDQEEEGAKANCHSRLTVSRLVSLPER